MSETVVVGRGKRKRKIVPAAILLGLTLSVGAVGLILAFGLHEYRIGAYIGIGCAAVIAPLIGMILPLLALETDTNSTRGADSHSGH